jgi:hypothetical protein
MAPYEELVATSRVRAAVTQFCVRLPSGVDRTQAVSSALAAPGSCRVNKPAVTAA